MGITMTNGQEELWKVEAIVEPKVEWERIKNKIGIGDFRIGEDELITFEKQLENKTHFYIVTSANNGAEAHSRAHWLMKSFLALLELEARRNYRFVISHMRPVQPKPTKDGWILLDSVYSTIAHVIPRPENLDLSLLKMIGSSLERLGTSERDRVLGALNFLYDGLGAYTEEQSFLSIYGGLNYLVSDVARKERGGKGTAKTTRSEDIAVVRLAKSKLLKLSEVESWIVRFNDFHDAHYAVLYHSEKFKEKEFKNKLDEIKVFFKEFLGKYIEYAKLNNAEKLPKHE